MEVHRLSGIFSASTMFLLKLKKMLKRMCICAYMFLNTHQFNGYLPFPVFNLEKHGRLYRGRSRYGNDGPAGVQQQVHVETVSLRHHEEQPS